ncbi:protein of unknown function [Burkholderia multivorans]
MSKVSRRAEDCLTCRIHLAVRMPDVSAPAARHPLQCFDASIQDELTRKCGITGKP